ncbi:hypothetical protein BSZ35_10905 [Salinibacter sp. 10B]|nr:hypothetical protein BSZ35_10905 [Salinibacter sp. 10B]
MYKFPIVEIHTYVLLLVAPLLDASWSRGAVAVAAAKMWWGSLARLSANHEGMSVPHGQRSPSKLHDATREAAPKTTRPA